jgi:hypothetical protein
VSFNHAARDFAARIVPVPVRAALKKRIRGQRTATAGAPPGLSRGQIDELCIDKLGAPAEQVSHLQISAWRKSTTGAFRVEVATSGGDQWSFYYKNSVLTREETPGLAGLPQVPGSEFTIYATATDRLAGYLAEAYSLTEIEPGVRFRLILEDLRVEGGFKVSVSDRDVLTAVQALPGVHQALSEWAEQRDATLFEYDRRFSTDLRGITRRALERWNEEKPTRSVATLLSNWPVLERIHSDNAIFDPRIQNPVHGDANRANVLVPANGAAGAVKLVDWEWAGWRAPHFDLASLTKGRSRALQEQAVALFAASDTSLSLGDHRALSLWALLDLRLLDASYVVAQHYGAPGASRMDLNRYLHISVSEILKILDQLDGDT